MGVRSPKIYIMRFPLSATEFALKEQILADQNIRLYYVSVVGQAALLAAANSLEAAQEAVTEYYAQQGFENKAQLFQIEKHYSLNGVVVLENGFTRF